MAASTLDVYDAFLKDWYLSEWVDQLTSMTTTWRLLRRKLTKWAGKQMVIPIRKGRNWGVGAIPTSASGSMATLNVAGHQSVDRVLVDGKLVTGALQIAQDTIDKSKVDRGAFFEDLDFEMRGLVDDVADYVDNVSHLAGNGALATITQVTSGTQLTVDNHQPFFDNMRIECWSSTGAGTTDFTASGDAAVEANLPSGGLVQVISAVQRNVDGSGVLTMVATAGAAIGSNLARAGSRNTGADTGYEPMGLPGLISNANPPLDSTFQGITRTGNNWWQSLETDATNSTFSEDLLQQQIDYTHDTSRGDIDYLMTQRITRRKMFTILNPTAALSRFSDTNVITPGFLGGKVEDKHPEGSDFLFFDGRIPIIVDRFCKLEIDNITVNGPYHFGTIYGLDMDTLYVALITDFTWWAPEGRILHRSDSRAFGVLADLYLYGQIVCDAPNKNFQLKIDLN